MSNPQHLAIALVGCIKMKRSQPQSHCLILARRISSPCGGKAPLWPTHAPMVFSRSQNKIPSLWWQVWKRESQQSWKVCLDSVLRNPLCSLRCHSIITGLTHVHPVSAVIDEGEGTVILLKPILAEHSVKDALRFSPKFLSGEQQPLTKPILVGL